MIIDAHHHLWRPGGHAWLDARAEYEPIRRTYTAEDLVEVTDEAGVDMTVLVEADADDPNATEGLLALAATTDRIGAVVGRVDVRSPDVAAAVERFASLPGGAKLAGVRDRLHADRDPSECASAETIRGVQALAEAGLTFDLSVRTEQLPYVGKLADAVEETVFILEHLGRPAIRSGGFEPWRQAVADLAQHPHVVAKVSGLVTEADWAKWTVHHLRPYFEAAVELFGADRLIWGSDWPMCTLAADYGRVLDVTNELIDEFAPTGRRRILGGTAAEVYGLED